MAQKYALGVVLLAFIISCSSDDGDDNKSSSSVGGGGSSSSIGSGQSGGSSSDGSCPLEAASDGSVTCGGQTYRTVAIGEQTWFAENLNYAAEGSACYRGVPANCNSYGRLYDWATAMKLLPACNSGSNCEILIQPKHQGICPEGWHIPSNADWDELLRYVDAKNSGNGGLDEDFYNSSTAGKHLKAATGWNDFEGKSGSGIDTYGFSALAGGFGDLDGDFGNVGFEGVWWSAGWYGTSRGMDYKSESATWGNYYKSYLFSVRCVHD
jgi:uncharacterized protein (TIGR02145 family)